MDLDLEGHGLSGQLLGVVFRREAQVDVLLIARGEADQLLFKAGDEGVAAQTELVLLALAALKGDAFLEAFVVDHSGVAFLGGTLDGDDAGDLVGLAVDFLFHFFVGDGGFDLGSFQALVLAELDLGVEIRLDGQIDGLVFVVVHVGHRGLTDRLIAFSENRFLVDVREDLFDGVIVKHFGTVKVLNHLAGRLALAEAGNGDVLAVLQISLLNPLLELFRVDADRELQVIVFLVGVLDVHDISSCMVTAKAACYMYFRRLD